MARQVYPPAICLHAAGRFYTRIPPFPHARSLPNYLDLSPCLPLISPLHIPLWNPTMPCIHLGSNTPHNFERCS